VTLTYGSVCSGIEAATVAWRPLGWTAVWFAEIEPFPSAVLAHHYPNVPNLGDMTALARRILTGEIEAPDVLVGGTPCQAFSVAGGRMSLEDARGNLTLRFVELVDAIDFVRRRAGKPDVIVVWENVPGVLSTRDNAFGCFLGGLAGEDDALIPAGTKWSNAGCVYGPSRAIAWRTLDAQYFGLAQRRRRVFVVASARNGFDPSQVLFEWDSLRRDSAPVRTSGKAAPTIPSRSTGGGGLGTDFDCDGGLIPDVAPTLRAGGNQTGGDRPPGTDVDTCTSLIPVEAIGFKAGAGSKSGSVGAALGLAPTIGAATGNQGAPTIAFNARQAPIEYGDLAGPIDTDGSTTGVAYEYYSHDYANDRITSVEGVSPAMTARPTGSGSLNVAYSTKLHNTHSNQAGKIYREYTVGLDVNSPPPALLTPMQVRRLTPVECERLQGFRDGYTQVLFRGKPAADGPRYKSIGNSMATHVMAWIGHRLATHVKQIERVEEAA
jgi:DNA (cytosine-5)-methyltransferase 1